jgi:hypothetical protein
MNYWINVEMQMRKSIVRNTITYSRPLYTPSIIYSWCYILRNMWAYQQCATLEALKWSKLPPTQALVKKSLEINLNVETYPRYMQADVIKTVKIWCELKKCGVYNRQTDIQRRHTTFSIDSSNSVTRPLFIYRILIGWKYYDISSCSSLVPSVAEIIDDCVVI